MKFRTLGRTEFPVSEIGYGAWGIGGNLWQGGSDDESVRALHRAMELGVNFIDTALVYGNGHSEKLVGRAIRAARHRMDVATKVPPRNRLWPARPGIAITDVFPFEYIIHCTEESLRNLKLDTIDLLQLHDWNAEWLHQDEWRKAFEELKISGKVRAVGASINDHQPDSGARFDTHRRESFPLAQEMNVGVLARVPLDEGALTGTITETTEFDSKDFRAAYFRGGCKKQVVEHVNALRYDLAVVNGDLAEVALRFVVSHPAVSTVIPGMRTMRNMERNTSVPDKGPLVRRRIAPRRD